MEAKSSTASGSSSKWKGHISRALTLAMGSTKSARNPRAELEKEAGPEAEVKAEESGGTSSGIERECSAQSGERRLTRKAAISFPDVDPQEARCFVEQGSTLMMSSKRLSCSGKLMRRRQTFHCSVDETWCFLQWAASPSSPSKKKWYLSDLSAVHPLVLDGTRMNSRSSNETRSSAGLHLQFEAVHGRTRVKFQAASREATKLWVTALQSHLARRSGSRIAELEELANGQFQRSDGNVDGGLDRREVQDMLKRLNCYPSAAYVAELFKTFDKDSSASLNEDEFKSLFAKILEKLHLRQFFERYSVADASGNQVMPCAGLVRFLAEVQGETEHTEESVKRRILAGFAEPIVNAEGDALTMFGFDVFMCSGANSLFAPEYSKLHQDMSQPLSHYWINCSHNTYLEGAQIAGTSSVEQYLQVLSQGCRCVEIDLWDGLNGEPIVTHGYTLSSKISFEEVAQALQDHGFDHSEFPLILSLENHCSQEQTVRVGQILEEIFGERLLRHPAGHEDEPLVSPAEARGRVLVKGCLKKMCPEEDGLVWTVTRKATEVVNHTVSSLSATLRKSIETVSATLVADLSSSRLSSSETPKRVMSEAELYEGIEHYNSLIYLVSKKWHSIAEDRAPCTISSFKASKASKNCARYGEALNEYHRYNLSRIFPPGRNLTSGNFAPLVHWARGAQLVALNFQTLDTSVLLNEGIFREQNGGFGYVLKPEAVLFPDAAKEEQEMTVVVTVLSAHLLPRPANTSNDDLITCPLVSVRLHEPEGLPDDDRGLASCSGGRVSTTACCETAVKQDGFSPSWNETFEFKVRREDVGILTFEVLHQDAILSTRSFVAAAAYPIYCLREGIRWVPLWDENRRQVPNCGMLVKLQCIREERQPVLQQMNPSGSLRSASFYGNVSRHSKISAFSERSFVSSLHFTKHFKEDLEDDSDDDADDGASTGTAPLDEREEVDSLDNEGLEDGVWNFGSLRIHRHHVTV